MNWFNRKFRDAPNEQLSASTGEDGEPYGTHIGDWCPGEYEGAGGKLPNGAATLVTSLLDRPFDSPEVGPVHAPVLDLDLEHVYYESTTPGHAALLLNVALTWEQYQKLLAVLEELGIIQHGFAEASRQRGYSACRTPWTKKPPKPEDVC